MIKAQPLLPDPTGGVVKDLMIVPVQGHLWPMVFLKTVTGRSYVEEGVDVAI